MLVPARMKRAALALALVGASSTVAAAGGFVGLGLGTGPSLSTSEDNSIASNGRSWRVLGGYRFGRISVEATIGGYDAVMALESGGFRYPSNVYLGTISGKYSLPLSDGFEAFGRIGLNKSWFAIEGDDRFDASGTGIVLGAGIEYRLNALVAGASIFVDYQYARSELDGELVKTNLNAGMWTLGATIGF